ncbi:MAG TPA: hypothetical protein ENJ95_09195 [Bacteroidetes bacterium]|nr:hypothetical protein [Bacteroidota bacterium]
MKNIIIALAIFAALPAFSQHQNAWDIFSQTEFQKTFSKELGMFMTWPKFSDDILKWQGKEVTIVGYIIPTGEAGGFDGIIISKYPYAMCFFCGKAGAESVAELRMKEKAPDFDMDKPYVFKGKLLLNDSDFDQLNFILTEVELTGL